MTYNHFIETILHEMQNALPPNVKCMLNHVTKNNGLELDGLVFVKDDNPLSITLYLNPYFAKHKKGTPLSDIIEELLDVFKNHAAYPRFYKEDFLNYQKARQNTCIKLVSKSLNEKLLEEVPWVPFQDLAMVCIYFNHDEDAGCSSVLINERHMALWNITKEEMFQDALQNTPHLMPPVLQSMPSMLKNMLSAGFRSGTHSEDNELKQLIQCMEQTNESEAIYVLTNTHRYFGAVCIAYPDILSSFAEEIHSDLIIIPSSIHEILLVPVNDHSAIHHFSDMVREVNESCIMPDEILSDHAYYYSFRKHALTY